MQRWQLEYATNRLENAPCPSATTDAALELIRQRPSDATLLKALVCCRSAPAALEALSAMQADSEKVFESVRCLVGTNPQMSWCLVESLSRLPWYNGMRAFLSLPDPPLSSPCAYPFYILVRNRIFSPSDLSGDLFRYYVDGLWRMLPVARSEDWRRPHDSVLAVVQVLRGHLDVPDPDLFAVYMASLLIGRIATARRSMQALKHRMNGRCDPAVRTVAELALHRMESLLAEKAPCGA